MIEAVKMDVEGRSGPLAENEVARLLGVLQNAEFKRSETRNITKDHSFKPRSLMEIAIEAQQRDAEIEADMQAEEALAAAQRTEEASASKARAGEDQNLDDSNSSDPNSANSQFDNQDAVMVSGDDGALMPADGNEDSRGQTTSPSNSPLPISDAAQNVTPDMASDDQPSGASVNLANDALANNPFANDAVEHDPIADNNDGDAAEDTTIAANFETVTAAFERGKAEGMIAGRDAGIVETKAEAEAAAQANLADKIAAFEAALVALAKPQALQAEDLSRSIHAAILRLASQRVGQQIDDMPENFLVRIEALVTSIGQKMNAGSVHINADDYTVMMPYLADTHHDFVAEPDLARGDIILKFGGVELHDIAETRLGGQYAETLKNMTEDPLETKDLAAKPTTAEAEPTTAEPTTAEAEPTTLEPTTLEPTTSEPTTLEPTTLEPTTLEPTTLEPTTLEPTTAEPTTAEAEPTTLEPTTLEPTTLEPTTAEPMTAEPMTAEPTKADNALQIRAMTTLRPLVTDNAESDKPASDQAQKDQPPVPSDDTSS
jgi:flagellar biosynthesis/type III secretory pathway protein FliH